MTIGNKIMELRKKNNITQEELAEKVGVTRQTISKWELDETSPDIKQAASLSKIFKVSLDELVNNDTKDILIEKVSNTEKLAGLIIKIIKVIGILFLVFLVIDVISLILFACFRKESDIKHIESVEVSCSIDKKDYLIEVASDGHFNCSNCSKEMQKDLSKLIDYSDVNDSIGKIEDYFKNNDGKCE